MELNDKNKKSKKKSRQIIKLKIKPDLDKLNV
jgi:hypothetical protein